MPSLMPYGDKQRKSRQILHHFLQPSAVGQYNPVVMKEVHRMLLSVLNEPEQFIRSIRRYVPIPS